MKMLLAYMMMHPGKKLTFMGQDFGYTKKWTSNDAIDWQLLKKENYRQINDLMRDLNSFYKENKALYVLDNDQDGFEWINEMDSDRSIISFIRKGEDKADTLIVVCNFTPIAYENYEIGVPYKGRYKEIFTTEDERYGGEGIANPRLKNARPGSVDGREYYISTTVEPLSVAVYNFTPLVAAKKEDVVNEAVSTDDVKDKKNSIKNKKIAIKKNTRKDTVISTKASEVSKAVSTKVNEVSKSVSSKAEKVSKSVTSKADEVSKKVASKASEVKIKAEEAKEFIAETVTVAADDVKKASKAKKNKNASKSK